MGFAQILADLHAPVGFDAYGYAYGDVTGNVFHTGSPTSYGPTFGRRAHAYVSMVRHACIPGPGDTIGCSIHLPPYEPQPGASGTISLTHEKYKLSMCVLPGSAIVFYKDGVSLGPAFTNIYRGSVSRGA